MLQYEREYNTMWYSPLILTDTIIFLLLCCTVVCLKVAINILILLLILIFLAPRLSNEHVMCSKRSKEMSQEG